MLFLRQYRAELLKLFARPRTWMGFGAFLALELILLYIYNLPSLARRAKADFERNIGFSGMDLVFDEYFRGLTLAGAIVVTTMVLLGGLFLALVSGDIVSKEVEDGTMRMTLCRPISRLRVLAVKYLTCLTYTFSLVFFIGGSSILIGWLWRGFGGMFVFIPEEKLMALFTAEEGLWRLGLTLFFYALSLCTVTSLGFLFSCTRAKPAAAAIVTLCILLIDRILYMIPQFEIFKPYFLTYRMGTCLGVLRDPIPWDRMLTDYIYLFGINGTLLILAYTLFARRDFKS
jgi:ABC-2 type transport system permease protein